MFEFSFQGFYLTDDILINTLFAGVLVGVAIAIVIKAGASTGGMDIPPLILNKLFKIPVSISMYVFDSLIVLAQFGFSDVFRSMCRKYRWWYESIKIGHYVKDRQERAALILTSKNGT